MSSFYEYLSAYRLLGLNIGVSINEIKSAYRKLAREIHPDKNRSENGGASHENFTKLLNAYILLCNDSARRSFEDNYRSKNKDQLSTITRDKYDELDKNKFRYKRRMREKTDNEGGKTSDKPLSKIREESLQLVDSYRRYLGDSETKREAKGLDKDLQRLLREQSINHIIGEFENFEKKVIVKLKKLNPWYTCRNGTVAN